MTTPVIEDNISIPPASKPSRKAKSVSGGLRAERTAPPVHPSRDYETWDEADIHEAEDKPWVRPSSLEAPPARSGFTQRWVRVGSMGKDDPTNTSRKFREGWKPRPSSTVPASYHAPTINHGKWAGCVGVEGMILCEMPTRLRDKRNAHYRAKTDGITNTIESELQKQSNPAMPIEQRRSSKVVKNIKIQTDD